MQTLPEGVVAHTVYTYEIETPASMYAPGDATMTRKFRISPAEGGFVIGEDDEVFETLDSAVQWIKDFAAREFQARDEHRILEGKRIAALTAYHAAVDAWIDEQISVAELVPVEELLHCDAIVAKSPCDSVATVHEFDIDGHYDDEFFRQSSPREFLKYCISFGQQLDSLNPVRRYVKASSRMKAVRQYTRARPTRADFGL